eukprot:1154453-Pelagomonas_calceolata.AAC.1
MDAPCVNSNLAQRAAPRKQHVQHRPQGLQGVGLRPKTLTDRLFNTIMKTYQKTFYGGWQAGKEPSEEKGEREGGEGQNKEHT